jgi:hypothetical protein
MRLVRFPCAASPAPPFRGPALYLPLVSSKRTGSRLIERSRDYDFAAAGPDRI